MKKYKKTIYITTFLIFLILAYLLLTNETPSQKISLINQIENKMDYKNIQEELSENYKKNMSEYFKNFLFVVNQSEFTSDDLDNIEKKALDLKVPSTYKDLHINFILAINKMKKFLETGNKEDKKSGNEIILMLSTNNSWLTD